MVETVEVRAGRLEERLRVSVLAALALLLVVLAGGQVGDGASVVVALLVIATVVAVAALLRLLLARCVRRSGQALVGRESAPPLPRVSEPDAAGHVRPRAPGGVAAR